MKILSLSAVSFTYYNVLIFYFMSTEAAKPLLPYDYSGQNSIVVVIVYIYDTYFCQNTFFSSSERQSF
jgi:hypothetical protein